MDLDQAKEKEKENESQIDKTIVDELNRRLNNLENQNCFSPGQSKVVAPFVVFGRDGKRVFSVDNNLAGLFNSSQTEPVAAMLGEIQKVVTLVPREGRTSSPLASTDP